MKSLISSVAKNKIFILFNLLYAGFFVFSVFNDIKTFTTTVENVYKYLIKLSKKEKGYLHPYIQYLLLYTIQGKVRRNFDNILLKTDESVKK